MAANTQVCSDADPHAKACGQVRRRYVLIMVLIVLLVIHFSLAVSSSVGKSNTFDEIAHLTIGMLDWQYHGRHYYNPAYGTLAQRWAVLPVLLGGFQFPDLHDWNDQRPDLWDVSSHFFFGSGNDLQYMLLLARGMIALVSVLLCLSIYLWSKKLFGTAGAIISLLMACFSPTLLAHARLVTADMTCALFFLLAIASLWYMLHRLSPVSVLICSLAVTGLLISKMSGPLIVPMAAILIICRICSSVDLKIGLFKADRWTVRHRLARIKVMVCALLAVGLLVWGGLWLACGYSAMGTSESGARIAPGPASYPWDTMPREGAFPAVIDWSRRHRVLPESYLYGLAFTHKFSQTRTAFLNGSVSDTGWRTFFIFTFLYKTPLAAIVLIGLPVIWLAAGYFLNMIRRHMRKSRSAGSADCPPAASCYSLVPLLAVIGVYGAVAVFSHINIGHRHILPLYPPLFILAGSAASLLWSRIWLLRAVVPVLLVILVVETCCTWPHFLAYFNPLAGGPKNGYRHLVDSSLDWGQDLPALSDWLERHHPHGEDRVYLSYFGTAQPGYYRINATPLPGYLAGPIRTRPQVLQGGVYCVSATMLQGLYTVLKGPWCRDYEKLYLFLVNEIQEFEVSLPKDMDPSRQIISNDWLNKFELFHEVRFARLCSFLRHRPPDDSAGYSILIYRLSDEELQQAQFSPPVERYDNPQVKDMVVRKQ